MKTPLLTKTPLRSGDFVVASSVRLLVVGLGLAAIAVPLPGFTTPSAVLAVFALPLPFVAAWWPDSGWVTGLLSVSVAEWIITSLFVGAPAPARTLLFGVLLYLLHATSAFAAALPFTRRVEPVLLVRALMRLLAVIAVSMPLMTAALLAPGRPGSILLALAGTLSALGVAVLLVVLVHRRPAG